MSLVECVPAALTQLKGLEATPPKVFVWTEHGDRLEIDCVAVDALSCAMRELRFFAGALRDASLETLQEWSQALCQRISYLLEHIESVEIDRESSTILVRSSPPDRNAGAVSYYEIIIQNGGSLRMCRYIGGAADAERQRTDLHCTHETFRKLVRDMVHSVPNLASPSATPRSQ